MAITIDFANLFVVGVVTWLLGSMGMFTCFYDKHNPDKQFEISLCLFWPLMLVLIMLFGGAALIVWSISLGKVKLWE